MSLKKRLCYLLPEFNLYIINTSFSVETIVFKYRKTETLDSLKNV